MKTHIAATDIDPRSNEMHRSLGVALLLAMMEGQHLARVVDAGVVDPNEATKELVASFLNGLEAYGYTIVKKEVVPEGY